MVRTLAEKKGLRATFMPKPFLNKTGNGCHAHLSVWDKKGKNLFADKNDKLALSKKAYNFMGGIMHSTEARSPRTGLGGPESRCPSRCGTGAR